MDYLAPMRFNKPGVISRSDWTDAGQVLDLIKAAPQKLRRCRVLSLPAILEERQKQGLPSAGLPWVPVESRRNILFLKRKVTILGERLRAEIRSVNHEHLARLLPFRCILDSNAATAFTWCRSLRCSCCIAGAFVWYRYVTGSITGSVRSRNGWPVFR